MSDGERDTESRFGAIGESPSQGGEHLPLFGSPPDPRDAMTIGQIVTILANPTHPKLAGRIGTVVLLTKLHPCAVSHVRHARGERCGGNPILEVEGVGRVLVGKDCVAAVEAVEAA